MTPERYQEVGQLYRAALEVEPEQRTAFLVGACGDDEALRQEVESLLGYAMQRDGLMDQPALEVAAKAIAADPHWSPVGQRLGHYQILSLLGKGGMGEVYLAQDTNLGRKVALKLLPPAFTRDQERLRRFKREARSASALNHPNILTIYEVGIIGDTHFIATEFIDGQTLRERLRGARLKLSEALDLAIQTTNALSAAHAAGIVHRDIKPENVMVRRDGIVKVLDFGLAKLSEPPLVEQATVTDSGSGNKAPISTAAGVVLGTVNYMSPEQARGLKVDQRTDIFSLGVMLYEMLMGRQPFTGETISHILVAILEQEPPPLPQHLPAELVGILKQALAKSVADRYASSQVLLADLKKLQMRLLMESKQERNSSPNELEDESATAQTSMLKQTTTAAPKAMDTAAGSGRQTNKPWAKQKQWLIALLSLLMLVGGWYGYRTFSPSNKQIESIAVLPFVNASGNAEIEYLSDGMTEALIRSLSQLPKLNVKARASVFRYKGKDTHPQTIGKELNAQAILNGRVVQHGDQLTLGLELIDAQTENVLWTEQYNRQQTDLVLLQSDLARDVSSKLKTRLAGTDEAKVTKHYTANLEAYQLYLKGRFWWNKRTGEALRKAIEYFQQALEKDPGYALAYAGLAEAYVLLPTFSADSPQKSYPQAKVAARRALELDETLAEAHTSLAVILFSYDWNLAESNREFQRAIELNPNYATAHHWYGCGNLVAMQRFDQAIAAGKRAQELDPFSLIINTDLGATYVYARQYDQAIEQYRKTIELDQNFYLAHEQLGWAYELKGLLAEATAEYQKARALNDDPYILGYLGHVYAALGKREESLKILDQMKEMAQHRYVPAYSFASVYAKLGEKEQAFQWLERSYQDRAFDLTALKVDPFFDNLHSDPRFTDLIRRIGL